MSIFLKKTTFFLVAIFIFGFSFNAKAGDIIDIEQPINTNINGNDIFKAENIYPGWSKAETLRVRNKSEEDYMNVYFKFDVSGNKLGEKMKFYVIRKKDKSYRVGGENDRWTLDGADGKNLYVDRLDPREAAQYEIKIKFNENAGNEFQGLAVKFDIDFKVEAQPVNAQIPEAESAQQILEEQGRDNVTGNPPNKLGEETKNEEATSDGQILGDENKCHSWSIWIWLLAILAFLGLSLISTQKTKEQKAKQHFAWQLGGIIGAIVLWYLFDKCYYYKWFPIIVVVIGILNHLYYQKSKSSAKKL